MKEVPGWVWSGTKKAEKGGTREGTAFGVSVMLKDLQA